MKRVFSNGLIVISMLGLTACNNGGGSNNNNNNNKTASIPGPQGQVTAMNDASTYCQFNQGSFICYAKNQFTGQQCNTTTYTYTDIPTMCQQLYLVQNQGFTASGQCNVSTVLTRLIQENCQGIAQQGNTNPWQNGNQNQQIDANFKTIQCEFEAYRVNQRRFFNSNTGTGKVTAMMTIDSRMRQDIDLRSKFLGIDIGSFGKTKMTFMPAGVKGTSDTITLSNDGLNGSISLSQSGFAGEQVSLVATSEDGRTKLSVSCKGQSQFKKNVTTTQFTKYVCRGQSNLFAGGGKEDIEISLPYNSSLMNNEIMLAEGLTAQVTGDETGADNARITFTAQGVGSDISVVSSAYLKTSTSLKASDGYDAVNVTCAPQ